jgi:hypothetical protein
VTFKIFHPAIFSLQQIERPRLDVLILASFLHVSLGQLNFSCEVVHDLESGFLPNASVMRPVSQKDRAYTSDVWTSPDCHLGRFSRL